MGLLLIGLTIVTSALACVYMLGFLLPDHRFVSRTITVNTPASAIFPLVGNLRRWSDWSPWADKDPAMEMSIRGHGVGQTMVWASEKSDVGQGRQEIVALESPSRVTTELNFGDMGGGRATFLLKENADGQGTVVTWSLETNMRNGVPFLRKPMATYFGFFLDGAVGTDYEKGLKSLKELAEGRSATGHLATAAE